MIRSSFWEPGLDSLPLKYHQLTRSLNLQKVRIFEPNLTEEDQTDLTKVYNFGPKNCDNRLQLSHCKINYHQTAFRLIDNN